MTIKRGSKVIWHRPAFETYKLKKNSFGKTKKLITMHAAKDFNAKCFGVISRKGIGQVVLLMVDGKRQMCEKTLSQIEEVDSHGN